MLCPLQNELQVHADATVPGLMPNAQMYHGSFHFLFATPQG